MTTASVLRVPDAKQLANDLREFQYGYAKDTADEDEHWERANKVIAWMIERLETETGYFCFNALQE